MIHSKIEQRQILPHWLVLKVFAMWILGSSPYAHGQDNPFKKILNSVNPKVVKVYGAGVGQVESYASGVLVSADGKIVTMQGAFLDGQEVRVVTGDGKEHSATVLKRNRQLRLALLQISKTDCPHFQLTDKTVGNQGDWILAISNAFAVAANDEKLSTMVGIISLRTSMHAKLNSRDTAYSGPMILLDAITSNPGGGGGAVVNRKGNLVGMIGRVIDSTETNTRLNYAVPQEELFRFVNNIEGKQPVVAVQKPKGKKLKLGIRIFKLSGKSAPAYIDRVDRRSIAKKAGIKPDDLVVSINGKKIDSVKDFLEAEKNLTDDRDVVIVVARNNTLFRYILNESAKALGQKEKK